MQTQQAMWGAECQAQCNRVEHSRCHTHATNGTVTHAFPALRVQALLPAFLRHEHWERRGNIPALTLLLQAYLRRAAPAIVQRQLLPPILGIFQKLVSVPRHYADAYALLAAVLAAVPLAELQPYLPQVFKLLFTVLTGPRKSTKNTVAFVVLVSKMVCWHGAPAAAAAMDGAQASSSGAVFAQVFSNNLAHVTGREDKRVVGVAAASALATVDSLRGVRSTMVHAREPHMPI